MKKSFRDCLSSTPHESILYAVDITSQPQYQPKIFNNDPFAYAKCSRALPIAREEDIVVLMGDLDQEYYDWLRSVGLGPAKVVAYGCKEPGRFLATLIAKDPAPVLEAIKAQDRIPVYVPFYCSERELLASSVLNAEIFGCDEGITKKYFNKESFKDECLSLKLPTVPGAVHTIDAQSTTKKNSLAQLEDLALMLLNEFPELVVRGAEGAAGSSVYTMDQSNLHEVKEKIAASNEKSFLLEQKMSVVSSPNDQWLIDRSGTVHHLGLSAQLFNGLKHVGNLKGLYFSDQTATKITEYSKILVAAMQEAGYRGVVGIDYIVTPSGIFPIENNARLNGSTFTISLAEEIERKEGKINCWKFFKAKTERCSFNALRARIDEVIYKSGMVNSVFPLDCDTLSIDGKFTPILFGEDFYYLEYLERKLQEVGVERF